MLMKQSIFTVRRSMSLCRRSVVCLFASFVLSGPVFAALEIEVTAPDYNANALVKYVHESYPRNDVYKVIDGNQVDYDSVFSGLSENTNDDLGGGAQDYFVQGDSVLVTSHDLTVNSFSSSFNMQGSANEYATAEAEYDIEIPFTITGEITDVYISYDVLTPIHVLPDPIEYMDVEIRDFGEDQPPMGDTRWQVYKQHNTIHGPPSGQPIDETGAHTVSLDPGEYELRLKVSAGKHDAAFSSYGAFYFGDTPGSVPDIPKAPISIDINPSDPNNYVETEGNYSDRVYLRAFSTQDENPSESVDFDASQIDPATLTLDGAPPVATTVQINDFDNDGDIDFKAGFRVAQTGIVCDNPEANVELSGATYAGEKFVAIDYVAPPDCPSCHP
jgi:hypothetical protein